MASSLGALAKMATAHGDLTEARRLFEESLAARRTALALAPGHTGYIKSAVESCNDLIDSLIRSKDHQAATKIVSELVSLTPDSGKDLFHAASVLARCAPLAAADQQLPESRRVELENAYAEQAVDSVRKSLKMGHRDWDAIRKDASFESLRRRADFGALLAGMPLPSVDPKP